MIIHATRKRASDQLDRHTTPRHKFFTTPRFTAGAHGETAALVSKDMLKNDDERWPAVAFIADHDRSDHASTLVRSLSDLAGLS